MSLPTVKAWADQLRAAFGAADFDAGLRQFGYFASEGGKTLDTRVLRGDLAVTPVLPLPQPQKAERR